MTGAALTAAQRQVVDAPGHVLVSAGAGSGKTRVLVERLLTLLGSGVRPEAIVCVTFTDLAARELYHRVVDGAQLRSVADPATWAVILRDLPLMTIGTIHSLCAVIARTHPVLSGAGAAFEVLDDTAERLWRRAHLGAVLAALPPDVVTAVPGAWRGDALETLLDDPVRAAVALQRAEATAAADDPSVALGRLFIHVDAAFTALRSAQGVATFADLERFALRALTHDEVRAHAATRVAHVLVDEVQDTSAAQWEILRTLAGGHAVLTLVGDRRQSIYGFRGADPAVFTAAQDLVVARGGCVVDLDVSFRSDPALVQVWKHALPRLLAQDDSAPAQRPTTAGRRVNLPPGPRVEGHVVLGDTADREAALARGVTGALQAQLGRPVFDRVAGRVRGAGWADMTVLLRARTHLGVLEQALRDAGIPYAVHGGRDLYRRPEIQDCVSLLRALADPLDDAALLATLRGPYGGWSDAALLALADARPPGTALWTALQASTSPDVRPTAARLHAWRDAAGTLSASRVLLLADQESLAPAVHAALPDGERRAANLRRFHALLRTWAQDGKWSVPAVARHLGDLISVDAAAGEAPSAVTDAVQVMTVHAAKGLEFPVVAYLGLLLPRHAPPHHVRLDPELGLVVRGEGAGAARWTASTARADGQRRAEHGRLAYVALTRAADHVILGLAAGVGDVGPSAVRAAFPDAPWALYDAASVPPVRALPLVERGGRRVLAARPGPGASLPGHLPVTALAAYARCPQAFAWRHLDGYLPLAPLWSAESADAPVPVRGRDVGTAVHRALECGWTPAELRRRLPGLGDAELAEVRALLAALDDPAYDDLRSGTWAREVPLEAEFGRVVLHGIADAVDRARGLIVDYKTDRDMEPSAHRLQLAVYAAQLKATRAGLVYLRHGHVHWFGPDELAAGRQEVRRLVDRMVALDLAPTPSPAACGPCAYAGVCAHAEIQGAEGEA
ncbi:MULTISPECIES: UvrD-helicase domain-containing protein [Deinococcus]|uniref:DNA 3'-5' helicase n=1 Tax=Deinococcus rufus TaxID=2136097 RepID=A0ABV7ZA73_9DEIO|nr:UvrD-helicase domain-containing protein [Deinococcus sp. AB2017081]WQE97141.1 UvrD-helicase domain-containing protein [Deinococcus sp. AB2017081]